MVCHLNLKILRSVAYNIYENVSSNIFISKYPLKHFSIYKIDSGLYISVTVLNYSDIDSGKCPNSHSAADVIIYIAFMFQTDGRYDTYVHTLFDLNPFAVIDLGQQYAIVSFYVVNSKDCCGMLCLDNNS
jgi:hypothetical protein